MDCWRSAQSVLGVLLMKKALRTIGVWFFGLVASGIFGLYATILIQQHLQYQCFALAKITTKAQAFCSDMPDPSAIMALLFPIGIMAVFACIRLWKGGV